MKHKIIISLLIISSTVFGQANYVNDTIQCLKTFSAAGHCLIEGEVSRLRFGVNKIPIADLELFAKYFEIVVEENKAPFIQPHNPTDGVIGLRDNISGDTLFTQSFYVVKDFAECKSKMDSTIILKGCSYIENTKLNTHLVANVTNKVILNVGMLDADKVKIKFTNGEIKEVGEGYLIVIPGKGGISELTFEYNGNVISKSMFLIKK
jgi:hypothetical protein